MFTPKVATKSWIQYQRPSPKIFEEFLLQLWIRSPSPTTIKEEGSALAQDSIPPDFLQKLAETEDLVKRLQQQNLSQKQELDHIHSSLEKEARMKYRGCNHPSKSFRFRHNSNGSSLDGSRDLHPSSRTRAELQRKSSKEKKKRS